MPYYPSAYGGLYQAGNQQIVISKPDAFVPLCLKNKLPSLGVKANGENGLVVQDSGDYELNYHVLISASDAVTVSVCVRKNGSPIYASLGTRSLAACRSPYPFEGGLSASIIVALQAGDILDLGATVSDTLPPYLDLSVLGNATLTLKKL